MDFHLDGKVNYTEFLAATLSSVVKNIIIIKIHFTYKKIIFNKNFILIFQQFQKEEKLWSAFKYFDTTDTGYITSESVIDALKNNSVPVNENGLNQVFNNLKKSNKRLNFDEFKIVFNGQPQKIN